MPKTRKTTFLIIFTTVSILLSAAVLENCAFLYLKITDAPDSRMLVEHFPAQFRLATETIRNVFPSLAPMQRTGKFLGFDFDPVLGFRQMEAIEEYGSLTKDQSQTVILTFGGSTTVKNNWPRHLIAAAQERGVKNSLYVINAGLWGYMNFNEKILFTSWLLPNLKERGITPDLVLTLDGVNDIWYRILSYFEYRNEKTDTWYSQYHGFHQHHDTDMQKLGTIPGAFKQLLANTANSCYALFLRCLPYSMKVLHTLAKKNIDQHPVYRDDTANTLKVYTIPAPAASRIITAFRTSLVDFYATAHVRGITFVSYLQPVSLKPYYTGTVPENFYYPGVDYMGENLYQANRFFTRLALHGIVRTHGLFSAADDMYQRLQKDYPGSFTSLISLFQGTGRMEELFKKDAIHYAPKGSKIIAAAIVDDLMKKGFLSSVQQATP